MIDLDHCPKCGGPADNGYDRCIPPNVYWCTKCMPHQTNTGNPVDFPTGCVHCNHPLYASIRCGVCGRWTDKLTPEEITELREGKKAIAEYVQSNMPSDMTAFAEHLKANPEQAKEFFQRAGILDIDGNLTEAYK